MPTEIEIDYDPLRVRGLVSRRTDDGNSSVWERISARFAGNSEVQQLGDRFDMPWPETLGLIREFGTANLQRSLDFRFRLTDLARGPMERFIAEARETRHSRGQLKVDLEQDDIQARLGSLGYERRLRPFQLRDLSHLLSLSHGANFSVPGAGKTSVSLALSMLVRRENGHLLVIAPKAAFPAWREVVGECIAADASEQAKEPFTFLDGSEAENEIALRSGATRFLMSYDLMVRQQGMIAAYLARTPVHLILDESDFSTARLWRQRRAAKPLP